MVSSPIVLCIVQCDLLHSKTAINSGDIDQLKLKVMFVI